MTACIASPRHLHPGRTAQGIGMTLRDHFIDAMSRAVTGVTIVTTNGTTGRFGQTVSAMSSVSADPPILLVCVNQRSPISVAILEHRVFAVSVLRADQRRLAEVFAGRPRSGISYDFSVASWDQESTGSPLLTGAVARFDCGLAAAHEVGTHLIFVGSVLSASSGAGAPLVYARRGYGELHAFPNLVDPDDALFLESDEAAEMELGEL